MGALDGSSGCDASALTRHNVTSRGLAEGQPMLFAHGFGCDQNMWRYVAPAFADDYRIVLFDYVGAEPFGVVFAV